MGETAATAPHVHNGQERPVLITGGVGFIGVNLADRLLSAGHPVLVLDDLSRPGAEDNLRWLQSAHGDRVWSQIADIRNRHQLREAVRAAGQVFHFAAQVAVTSSLQDPVYDFEVNARGTLDLLEELRALDSPPPLVFTSTNKVYGDLRGLELRRTGMRYEPADPSVRQAGISEDWPLALRSPYGCSKGTADQYVLDSSATFGLPAVVLRMSCIYGPHQMGTEDQGWVAHFLKRAIQWQPITVFGDGCQVRDVLYVEDLVEALLLAQEHMGRLSGRAFNIGGGPANAISLLELIDLIGELHGERPAVQSEAWRPGDQRYYVSNHGRFSAATGWAPRVGVREGVRRLYRWLTESRAALALPR